MISCIILLYNLHIYRSLSHYEKKAQQYQQNKQINSEGQQFHQYQQNKQINSDGQQWRSTKSIQLDGVFKVWKTKFIPVASHASH